jgi:hypothetical protein
VSTGKIRWVLGEQGRGQGAGPRLPGDTRTGSKAAMAAVASVCRSVSLPGASTANTTARTGSASSEGSLYDCQGRAGALSASARQSTS